MGSGEFSAREEVRYHESLQDVLLRCKKANVTLVSDFKGYQAHYGKGLFPYENKHYTVKCNACGFEYVTTVNPTIGKCPYCYERGYRSLREEFVAVELEKLGVRVERNHRSLAINPESGRPYEVDLYLPDYSMGIEFNGFYWHKFQKRLLTQYWSDVDMSLTESQICSDHGVYQVHNSGDWKFRLIL